MSTLLAPSELRNQRLGLSFLEDRSKSPTCRELQDHTAAHLVRCTSEEDTVELDLLHQQEFGRFHGLTLH